MPAKSADSFKPVVVDTQRPALANLRAQTLFDGNVEYARHIAANVADRGHTLQAVVRLVETDGLRKSRTHCGNRADKRKGLLADGFRADFAQLGVLRRHRLGRKPAIFRIAARSLARRASRIAHIGVRLVETLRQRNKLAVVVERERVLKLDRRTSLERHIAPAVYVPVVDNAAYSVFRHQIVEGSFSQIITPTVYDGFSQ